MMKLKWIVLSILFSTFFISQAQAEDMAGLQVNFETGVDALVAADARQAIKDAFKGNSAWSYKDVDDTRARLNPVVRDCFTVDCLKKAGQQAQTKAGIRVSFSGEAQIYDWTVETFDLRDGSQLAIRKGACELCGRSEVSRTFRSTMDSVLSASKLKSSGSTSKPPANTPVTTKPDTTPTTTPSTGTPTDTGVRIVKIDISTEPPDAVITFRDAEVGRGRVTVEVGPGDHLFTFTAEGHRTVKEMVVVEGDATNTALRVHLPKKEGAPEAVEVLSRGPVDRLEESRVVYGVIGTVFGLGLIGTGMYLGAIDGEPNCDGGTFSDCAEIYDTSTAAFLTTFTGTALLTAGGVLLAWEALAGSSSNEKSVQVAPSVSPDGAGIGIFGRF
jgi:hypothetical protein